MQLRDVTLSPTQFEILDSLLFAPGSVEKMSPEDQGVLEGLALIEHGPVGWQLTEKALTAFADWPRR